MSKHEALYMNIYTYLKANIMNGQYDGGKRLPTELELTKQFYVSRITPKRALNTLADEGLIVRIPGKGSFTKESFKHPKTAAESIGKRMVVALVMGGYASSFGLDILNGVIDTGEKLEIDIIIKSTLNSQEKEAKIIRDLIQSGVAGIIVQPAQGEFYSETILRAVYDGYPIVMLDRMVQGINVPYVGVDNAMLSRFATEKLLKNNHRSIGLIAFFDETSSTIKERMHGFTEAFMENGYLVNKNLFFTNLNDRIFAAGLTNEREEAYEFIVKEIQGFIALHPEMTAIFGTEYIISRAAFDAVRRSGKAVPEDISIVSFDTDTGYIGPHKMSHIKQPQREMGIKACEILHKVATMGSHASPGSCILPGEWAEGFSIRKI